MKQKLRFSKSLSNSKFHTGIGVPVYSIIHDDRSDDYQSAEFEDDLADWTPNSWGY